MLSTGKLKVIHETKFHSIYAGISKEDFSALGFNYGDSLDIFFSNGLYLPDAPYYDGYYKTPYRYLVCGYSSYPMPSIAIESEIGAWAESGLSEEKDTVEIVLHEKGKYAAVQEAFCQSHPKNRDYYVSDEAFVNFRAVAAPNMKENFIYRGGTPLKDDFGFMKTADDLIRRYGINFVINLSESEEETAEIMEGLDGSYIKKLYREGKVVSLDQSVNTRSPEYAQNVTHGLREMLKHDGPVYFHCVEGKDRTGFMSILLMALAGGGLEDFEKDYMQTYQNFFYVDKEKTPEKYELIREHYLIKTQMNGLCNTKDETDFTKYNFFDEACRYLEFGGMSRAEVDSVIRYICKP